jgi:hypothetical protein
MSKRSYMTAFVNCLKCVKEEDKLKERDMCAFNKHHQRTHKDLYKDRIGLNKYKVTQGVDYQLSGNYKRIDKVI